MNIRLDGKVALITGGTRGIGRAISIALARAGASVAVNFSRNERAARETAAAIEAEGGKMTLLKGDASDFDTGRKLVTDTVKAFGRLDILVNNAGISHNTPFMMLEPEEWKTAVGTNLDALYAVTHPALKYLTKHKVHGRILNITSVCGVRPMAAVPVHYAATKAAVVGFTWTLAKEVGRYGVVVNAIAPGLIETAFSVNLPETRKEDFQRFCPMGRIGKPEEVADLAVFLVSDFNSYMTGETVVVSGGL